MVTDIHMPFKDGYEVASFSKQRYPETPVLLLSGVFENFDRNQYVACGADQSLKKPFDSNTFLSAVESLTKTLGS